MKMLWLSYFFSRCALFIGELAVVTFLLSNLNDDYLYIGMIYFIKFIPFLIFGTIGGWLADNRDTRKVMLFSEGVRIFSSIGLGLVIYFDIDLSFIMILLVLDTIGRCLYQPSYQKCLYMLTEEDERVKNNSISQTVGEISSIIAPLIFSLSIIFLHKYQIILVSTLFYLFSFFSIFTIKAPFSEIKRERFSLNRVLNENLMNIKKIKLDNKVIFHTIVISSVCILFTGAILRFVLQDSVIKVYDESIIGYVFSFMSLGALVGGIFLSRKTSFLVNPMLYWFLYGLSLLFVYLFIEIKNLLFISAFIVGIIGVFVDIAIVTHIQTHSKSQDLGKNFGLFSTLANIAEASSGILAGGMSYLGVGITFIVMSVLISITGLYGQIKNKER